MYVDLVTRVAEKAPDPNDVVAGWTAFGIFIALFVVVGILGVSLTRRLKNVDRAEEMGLYDPSTKKLRAQRQVDAEAAAAQDLGDADPPAR